MIKINYQFFPQNDHKQLNTQWGGRGGGGMEQQMPNNEDSIEGKITYT